MERRGVRMDIGRVSVNSNLKREREGCTTDPNKLAEIYFGKSLLSVFARVRKLLAHNLDFDAKQLWWMSGSQRYLRACKQAQEFVRMVRHHKLMDDPDYMNALMVMTGEDFFVHVHLAMFVPSLENFANDEQKKKWLGPAKNFSILGTYAQTELGHGSNVAGLETTADFDPATDEWVLNTPTMTATKWWAGGLGKSCNHCILMARVRIKGVDYGVHPFFMQIRDLHTHHSLDGIVLRHLGQKLGYNGMDNGTMELHDVRIPRENLFMRFCKVDEKGNYSRLGDQKLLYAVMTFTRKQIIMAAGLQLAKCVTIAMRYSALRRQFPAPSEQLPQNSADLIKVPEAPVLDYSTQQRTLVPCVAISLAYFAASQVTSDLYDSIMDECHKGNFGRLSDIHAATSALKATMTLVVVDSIEACRKACGGHGYCLASGLPLHLTNYIPQATYEGDFVVLSIQAGRILLKAVQQKMAGELPSRMDELTTKYIYDFDPSLSSSPPNSPPNFRDAVWLLTAYKQRSCILTYKAAQKFANALQDGCTMLEALDKVKIDLTHVTTAYANVLILSNFQILVDRAALESPERETIEKLRLVFALHWMEKEFTQFAIAKVTSPDHYEIVDETLRQVIQELRPNLIGIVDSFGFPDYLLNSAIGRYDGRAYESLFKATLSEPLNQADVTEGYYRYLQFIIHPERQRSDVSRL